MKIFRLPLSLSPFLSFFLFYFTKVLLKTTECCQLDVGI